MGPPVANPTPLSDVRDRDREEEEKEEEEPSFVAVISMREEERVRDRVSEREGGREVLRAKKGEI